MAECVGAKECYVGVDKPIIFENKTDTDFKVATGIIFYKSGLYNVSIIGNKTTVSKVSEQKKGRWIPHKSVFGGLGERVYTCERCGYNIGFHTVNYCPNCGSYNRGEQE